MNILHNFKAVAGVSALLFLGACADMNTNRAPATYPQPTQSNNVYSGYGVVQAIDLVGQRNSGVPAGAIRPAQERTS